MMQTSRYDGEQQDDECPGCGATVRPFRGAECGGCTEPTTVTVQLRIDPDSGGWYVAHPYCDAVYEVDQRQSVGDMRTSLRAWLELSPSERLIVLMA